MNRRFAHGRRSAIRTFIAYAVLVMALWAICSGAYHLWAQHSGTPGRVELGKCWRPTFFSFPGEFAYTGGKASRLPSLWDCTAVWRPAAGTEETVTVHGVEPPTPRFVDVHIHGDRAYTNALWLPAPLVLGSAIGGFELSRLLAMRRSRASRPSLFHRGPEVSEAPATPSGPQELR